MNFDFEVQELDNTGWTIKTLAKYSKLCATIEIILLAFPSLHMTETGFNRVHYLQSKQRSILNRERGDMRLKLTNLRLNIRNLLSAYQSQPFR